MSIYIVKDNEKKKINISATDVQLLDIDGKFKSKNLEDAMKEIGSGTEENMTRIEGKIANLEDNVIGSELMGTIATTLRGAIAEHEKDINALLKNGVISKPISSTFDSSKISTWTENGVYLTASSGIIDLPKGWSQGRHTVVVFSTGNDNYSFQLITPYAGTVTANKKIAFRSNIIEGSEWKELSDGTDTGWTTIELLNDVLPYNTVEPLQYRKVGNMVYLRGAVKNITKTGVVIANLPTGFRPKFSTPFAMPGTANRFNRLIVSSNGDIRFENTSATLLEASNWYPINTSFLVD